MLLKRAIPLAADWHFMRRPWLLSHDTPITSQAQLTDADRHDRFVAMAQQVGASDDVKDFEKAFQKAFKNAFDKIACQKDAARRRPS